MSTRWIFRSLAGLLLTVAVPAAVAQAQLTANLSNVFVQWQGSAPAGTDPDPLFVERDHGIATDATTRGRSSLGDGRMQAYSSSFNYPEGTVASYAGITVSFENTGTAPLVLAAGDLRANLDVSMLRVAGVGPAGNAGNTVIGVLGGQLPGVGGGAARLDYQHIDRDGGLPPIINVNEIETGGYVVVPAIDPFGLALSATLSAPAFTVGVGQSFQVQALLQQWSSAGTSDTMSWFAETDGYFGGRGLQLFLDLPAGVTVISPVPLTWAAAAVPEPTTLSLILAGLAVVMCRRPRGTA